MVVKKVIVIMMMSYNENIKQQWLSQEFANIPYKIVSPVLLQKLINDFAVCKHCSGTFVEGVTSSHGFRN